MNIIIAILLNTFTLLDMGHITIWLCGDSTMSVKETKAYPETGWGMPFVHFWDSTVTIKNLAKNGRSTKTFISEKLWQQFCDGAKPGDYVFIQFGHNDESKDKKERYSTPDTFKMNLVKMIDDARARKVNIILLTPVSRRKFDDAGNALQTHTEYSGYVREVATLKQVPFIDLDEISRRVYQDFGKENSKLLFLQLKPGEHPNYPEGKEDNTHFNEFGARKIAELILAEIRKTDTELTKRIIVPVKK
ncbi:MAG: rhamnogalacturonan acetylesterase [Sediminibacterium sp.]|nr:rhamnogalacturonan acetylesterase [Sediminibacterium sp.]MBX9779046.1 rhamnogalacturonan acetylesterase [Chitinophagaceae bacterium]